MREFVLCGLCAVAFVAAIYVFGHGAMRGLKRKFVLVGLAIVVGLPWVVWQLFDPPIFDITAYRDHVDYEFRDPKYAAEFADANGINHLE